jgi:hypothetical protein
MGIKNKAYRMSHTDIVNYYLTVLLAKQPCNPLVPKVGCTASGER